MGMSSSYYDATKACMRLVSVREKLETEKPQHKTYWKNRRHIMIPLTGWVDF